MISYNGLINLKIMSIIIFVFQFMRCLKAERIKSKLTPIYIILFFTAIAVALYIGVFGNTGFGTQKILAIFLAVGLVAALIGDALAWIAYGLLFKIKG